MKRTNLNIESNSQILKIHVKKNVRKNVENAKINVCLKECYIVSGVGMNRCQPPQSQSCAMIPVFFWCDCFLCQ